MSIFETISASIKDAMRAKDREQLSALRDIKSKLLLEMTKEGGDNNNVDDAVALKILSKLHKQRVETAALYADQGREDLQQEELAQAAVIERYLPAKLSDAEVEEAVQALIEELGASGMKDMGKVMGAANKKLGAQADGSVIAGYVKKALQG